MKTVLTLALIITFFSVQAQVNSEFTDINNKKIQNAIVFYKQYLSEFNNDKIPDYSKYWSKEDCQKYKTPDALVYSISSDYPTYNLAVKKTIFYARQNADLVHLYYEREGFRKMYYSPAD